MEVLPPPCSQETSPCSSLGEAMQQALEALPPLFSHEASPCGQEASPSSSLGEAIQQALEAINSLGSFELPWEGQSSVQGQSFGGRKSSVQGQRSFQRQSFGGGQGSVQGQSFGGGQSTGRRARKAVTFAIGRVGGDVASDVEGDVGMEHLRQAMLGSRHGTRRFGRRSLVPGPEASPCAPAPPPPQSPFLCRELSFSPLLSRDTEEMLLTSPTEADLQTQAEAETEGSEVEGRWTQLPTHTWGITGGPGVEGAEARGSEFECEEACMGQRSSGEWEERRAEMLGCRFGTPMRLWNPAAAAVTHSGSHCHSDRRCTDSTPNSPCACHCVSHSSASRENIHQYSTSIDVSVRPRVSPSSSGARTGPSRFRARRAASQKVPGSVGTRLLAADREQRRTQSCASSALASTSSARLSRAILHSSQDESEEGKAGPVRGAERCSPSRSGAAYPASRSLPSYPHRRSAQQSHEGPSLHTAQAAREAELDRQDDRLDRQDARLDSLSSRSSSGAAHRTRLRSRFSTLHQPSSPSSRDSVSPNSGESPVEPCPANASRKWALSQRTVSERLSQEPCSPSSRGSGSPEAAWPESQLRRWALGRRTVSERLPQEHLPHLGARMGSVEGVWEESGHLSEEGVWKERVIPSAEEVWKERVSPSAGLGRRMPVIGWLEDRGMGGLEMLGGLRGPDEGGVGGVYARLLDVITDRLAEFSNSSPQPSPRGTPRQYRLDAMGEFSPPEEFSARHKHSPREGCSLREGCSQREVCSVRNVKTWSGDGALPDGDQGKWSHGCSPRLQSPRTDPKSGSRFQSPRTEPRTQSPNHQSQRTEPKQVKLDQPHGASAMRVGQEKVAKHMSHKNTGARMPLNGPSSAYYDDRT